MENVIFYVTDMLCAFILGFYVRYWYIAWKVRKMCPYPVDEVCQYKIKEMQKIVRGKNVRTKFR